MSKLKLLLIAIFILFFTYSYGDGVCTVTSTGINLGNYNPFKPDKKITYGDIKVKCYGYNGSVSFLIKVKSINTSDPNKRYLYSNSRNAKLFYNIYYNNCILGDGSSGSCIITAKLSLGKTGYNEMIFPIKGVIFPYQNVPVASDYKDTLNVIIEY